MPMPKALVAQMTRISPARNSSWMRFFSGARQAGVEMGGRPALARAGTRRSPRWPPGVARNTIALPARPRRRRSESRSCDALELVVLGDRLHLEAQVVPLDAALEQSQFAAGLRREEGEDLLPHVLLGGGGEAGDGRDLAALLLARTPG